MTENNELTAAAPGILRKLGFFGLESIEVPLLAALFTGEPVLLVGTHGSAKTALVRALAEALKLRFWCYDASKAMFEDIIGFPSPAALARGEADYVPTPLSIWNKEFVLIDEISRAAPAMQNKWLEVVRSRQVMGRAVPGLKYVFAAMNPPGYLGAYPLDPALVGRFATVLTMPNSGGLSPEDLRRVVENLTADDAPGCHGALRAAAPTADGGHGPAALRRLLARMGQRAPRSFAVWGEAVSGYVTALALHLRDADVFLDGRRLGMLRRNLLVALLVADLHAPRRRGTRAELFYGLLRCGLPDAAGDRPIEDETYYPAHLNAWRAVSGQAVGTGKLLSRLAGLTGDLAVRAWNACRDQLGEVEHHGMLNHLQTELAAGEGQRRARAVVGLRELMDIAATPAALPADVLGRVMGLYAHVTLLGGLDVRSLGRVIAPLDDAPIDPASDGDSFAWRVAIGLSLPERGGLGRLDSDEIGQLLGEMLPVLRRQAARAEARP